MLEACLRLKSPCFSQVAIPIPKPVDLNYNELVYKLQFSFSGE